MSNEQDTEYITISVGGFKMTLVVSGVVGYVLGMITAIIFFGMGVFIS